MDSTKPRNHKFNDYLSLDMYVVTTAGYHEIAYIRTYFFEPKPQKLYYHSSCYILLNLFSS